MAQQRTYQHKRAIALAKIREGYHCELCPATIDIQGHHIIDLSFGGEATPENILVVCKTCHDKIHEGKIKIDTLDYRDLPSQ